MDNLLLFGLQRQDKSFAFGNANKVVRRLLMLIISPRVKVEVTLLPPLRAICYQGYQGLQLY